MAPWKIVLQPQKVSRAARVSGNVRNQRKSFKLLLHFITISHIFTFCMKYKITHGINVSIMFQLFQSIDIY